MSIHALFEAKEKAPSFGGLTPITLEKRLGLVQLEALSMRTGISNYATGRAFSASSLKRLYNHPLKYIEYASEPPRTDEDRIEDFYNAKKSAFTIGEMFEDFIRGRELYDAKYMVLATDTVSATAKKEASEAGQLAVRARDHALVIDMAEALTRQAPELAEMIQGASHEVQKQPRAEVFGTEILLNGFSDFEAGGVGGDIKTIDSLSDASSRIFEKSWGRFQYWMQAALYHMDGDGYDEFKFVFIAKKSLQILTVSLDREALDLLADELKRCVLTPALYYLENGFEEEAPFNYRPFPNWPRPKITLHL